MSQNYICSRDIKSLNGGDENVRLRLSRGHSRPALSPRRGGGADEGHRSRALIEDHRGLAGYSRERIEVNGGRTRLVINGEALELTAMDREALLVTGCILSVEFV